MNAEFVIIYGVKEMSTSLCISSLQEVVKGARKSLTKYPATGHDTLFWARPGEELKTHISRVAKMASTFANSFGGVKFAQVCGLLHDLGKYSNAFQGYMHRIINHEKAVRGETIHSLQGGLYAYENFKDIGIADIVINVVASHHGELLDMLGSNGRTSITRLTETKTRKGHSLCTLYKQAMSVPEVDSLIKDVNEELLKQELNALIMRIKSTHLGCFGIQMFVRMVYSCLVDADRCDAAGFDGCMAEPPWTEIEVVLDRHMAGFENNTPLNKVRDRISQESLKSGSRERGVYTLSIPTGGGKTLSSLRFAIRHARQNHLKRIVYVIPYLSIIDQTVKELRTIFGLKSEEWMLEHHSNVIIETKDDEENNERKTLTERWDCPIIVTTMVRFMETMISNRASDLRRLHNMTESVFVFDEIQSLPIRCTYLFNMSVNFLCQICGSSAVLCTATQPALAKVERAISLSENHSLVELSNAEKELFKRVKYVYKTASPMSVSEIGLFAGDFLEKGLNVLVVLNTKKTALAVYNSCNMTQNSDKVYLTTDLCAQHRKDNIERIRVNIKGALKKPTLCVSTQLIEAGVDLSFDVVIRANAGIDNIIQAGGRCNRNGEHKTRQAVYVIEVEDEDLSRLQGIAMAKNATRRALDDFPDAELSDSYVMDRFYAYLFDIQRSIMAYPIPRSPNGETVYGLLDRNVIGTDRYRALNQGQTYQGCPAAFATAADAFHMIEGEQISAIVPYAPYKEEIMKLVSEFKQTFDPKERVRILRSLQPYAVSLYASREFWLQEVAEKVRDTFYLVGEGHYDSQTGLTGESFDPVI